jgi:pyruvate,water dikinase
LAQAIDAFLQRYGYHSVKELDITVPHWREDPSFVLRTLQGYVKAGSEPKHPAAASQAQYARYQEERAKAESFFKGRLGRKGFFTKLELSRSYAWWREEMRDHSTRMYYLIRIWSLELARRLVIAKALENLDDVWYLSFQEAHGLLINPENRDQAQALIRKRRRYNLGFRNFENPNELGVGLRAIDSSRDGLNGVACSPGKVRGRARIIASIDEAHRLEKGDILVTRFTDPGWTPLFNLIDGVVTETGGLLSHAAVISREYGIPAVLAVPQATQRIQDGEIIVLDGDSGRIETGKSADA